MSGVRVLIGTRKGAFILTSDGKRADRNSVALTLRDGNSTTSPDHPLTQTASMLRNLAAGLDN
jgi:hypothetical protein